MKALAAAVVVGALLYGCGGGGGGGPSVTPSTGVHATGTGTGTLVVPPTSSDNSTPIVIDVGPSPNFYVTNIPYVSVTVCTPGTGPTTASCQTIDHIQVDTMSSGLRILQSALSSSMQLPEETTNSSSIGECQLFADGFVWGSVRLADIYIGKEKALSIPIQDIGDLPGGVSTIPSACTNTGGLAENTLDTLGAKGILGVGMFEADSGSYFTCSAGSCSSPGVPLTTLQSVRNPVFSFEPDSITQLRDNQGVVVTLPAIGPTGAQNFLAGGVLAFGIGTSSNNGFGGGETAFPTDGNGDMRTTYQQVGQASATPLLSFLDTGSSALFYPDSGTPTCTAANSASAWDGYFCPGPISLTQTRPATNLGINNTPTLTFNFEIDNPNILGGTTVAANLGAPAISSTAGYFDWGLPFFFGKTVFVVNNGVVTTKGTGPLFAY